MANQQTIPPSYNPECIPVPAANPVANNPNPFYNEQPGGYNQGNMYVSAPAAPYQPEGQNARPQTYAYNYQPNQQNQPLIRMVTAQSTPSSVSSVSISSSDHEQFHRTTHDSTDQCKKLLLYGACFWCIAIALLVIGSVMLNDNLKFKRESRESTCMISSYNAVSCTYECNCYTDHEDKRHCDTCWGYKYEYYATSDTCGDHTLHQHSYDDNGACPQNFKPIGYTNKCWVVCDKYQFSFSSPASMITWSVVLLIIGGCCCCGGSGFSCKYACCRD
eukprot:277390_1